MSAIHQLRNRIAHHQKICHWKDLPQQHRDTAELLGGMNRGLLLTSKVMDRFEETFREGPGRYIFLLNQEVPNYDTVVRLLGRGE